MFCVLCAATPAPSDKLEKNGKEGEKEESEAQADKERVKEKEEGKEGGSNRTADPDEVGHVWSSSAKSFLPIVIEISVFASYVGQIASCMFFFFFYKSLRLYIAFNIFPELSVVSLSVLSSFHSATGFCSI